tara:strand:- start:84 stop:437 length:354 start_codon:yes stop_codon:yes gene_type:complete
MGAQRQQELPECSALEHGAHDHQSQPAHVVHDAARMCAAMGDPLRLALLELLWDGPHCVSELAQDTDESMSAISQRLKILFNAKLVKRKREGKHVFYSLADDHIRELLNQLFQHASE